MDASRTDGGSHDGALLDDGGGDDAGQLDAGPIEETDAGDAGPVTETDAGDAGPLTESDAGDAGPLTESDAGDDSGTTAGPDAGDEDAGTTLPTDAGYDAGPVTPTDAGYDSGAVVTDAGSDAGSGVMSDAGSDAGPITPPADAGGSCTPPEEPPLFSGCNPTMGIECDGDWSGRCTPGCAATHCCSPQMNAFACVPRNADGSCPAADLWVDAARLAPRIETVSFTSSACEFVEGCIGGTGARRLLRFSTWTPNTGGADMFLGNPTGSPYFEYSSCHGHHHFNTYAEYELLSADGRCVAAEGHKQAFCLLDYYEYPCDDDPRTPAPRCTFIRGGYTCSYQGIRRNAQDVYSSSLDCQWIDITGVPPGDYIIRIRINTEHILNESDYSNNEARVPFRIP